jgi:hypothetical protein
MAASDAGLGGEDKTVFGSKWPATLIPISPFFLYLLIQLTFPLKFVVTVGINFEIFNNIKYLLLFRYSIEKLQNGVSSLDILLHWEVCICSVNLALLTGSSLNDFPIFISQIVNAHEIESRHIGLKKNLRFSKIRG